jgi:hypothetical protein
MLWGRLTALERADDAPFLVVRNASRAAPQSTHQVSWRDYNGANYKESPNSYPWSAEGLSKYEGFAGFRLIRIARNVVQCIHVAKLSRDGGRLGLTLLHNLRLMMARCAVSDGSLSPPDAHAYRCRTSPAKRHPRCAQEQPAVVCTARLIGLSDCAQSRRRPRTRVIVSLPYSTTRLHPPIRISACKSRKTPSPPSTTH